MFLQFEKVPAVTETVPAIVTVMVKVAGYCMPDWLTVVTVLLLPPFLSRLSSKI